MPAQPNTANKHGDGQVYKWNSVEFPGYQLSSQKERKMSCRSVAHGEALGLVQPAWAWAWGRQEGPGVLPRPGGCPFTATEGVSSSKRKICIWCLKTRTQLYFSTIYNTLLNFRALGRPRLALSSSTTHLHPWNSPLQNAVQTNNLPLPAQMPRTQ